MKCIFLIPVWKRPEITRVCLTNLKALGQDAVCIVSRTEDHQVVTACGYPSVWYPNDYLGAKWNHGLKSIQNEEWDFMVTLGSDDIIKTSLLEFYSKHPHDHVLITDKIYFIDIRDGRSSLITRARIGAGRRISREAVERCNYRLWTDTMNKSLDRDSNGALQNAGLGTAETRTEAHVTGLKSDMNIWAYDHTIRSGGPCAIEAAMEGIPLAIQEQIQALLPIPKESRKLA